MNAPEPVESQSADIEAPIPGTANGRIWGSDLIADAIRNIGLDYIALNPGASFRGLHDSLVNYTGNRKPQMLLCLHEENAVSIAHGYAKAASRPMGVILHSNVGLMHGAMGVFNAWCDRVPMIMLGATGPADASKRRPWIDWIHTSNDQAALVRQYTKWDDQPGSVPAAMESLARAYQMADTTPKGPVYINLDASLQEEEAATAFPLPEMSRHRPPPPAAPNAEQLAQAAQLLSTAKNPVLLIGRVSRSEADWQRRIALAEALSAKVITDLKQAAAFPTAHPLHVGPPGFFSSPDVSAALRQADVILSLDWVDLAGTLKQAFGNKVPDARVIHASLDQQLHRGWGTEYFGLAPVDLYAMCDADAFTAALAAELAVPAAALTVAGPVASTPAGQTSIKAIADSLNSQAAGQDICLARLPLGWNGGYRDFDHPLDYLGYDGGGGVGSGPGICVGAALALRGSGRMTVGVIGDGDFLMGVTALWTACHYRIPLLLIVANNRSFFNDEMHQERVALERGRPPENRWIGQRIDEPDIDLAAMARAQGAIGLGPITDVAALDRAVAEGLQAVRNGNVCVIDVRVIPGYDANLSGQVTRAASVSRGPASGNS